MKCLHPRWILASIVAVALSLCADVRASSGVPLTLQAQLTSRVCSFDRNFKDRAGSAARVLVVHRGGDAESEASATAFARIFGDLRPGGVPVAVEEVSFTDVAALAARVRAQPTALVYFAVGLEPEIARAATALVGADVLTVGASGQFAHSGAVVGFDLEESRPKLVVNVRSAKAQNVSFKSELLELARLVE